MVAQGAARKRPIAAPQGDDAPEIISLKTQPAAEVERRDLFEIDDVMYSIPVKVAVNKALKYLHIARMQGTEAGVDYMLGLLLGEEGYAALRNFDDLTEDDLAAVIKACEKVMAGAVENPKGKRKNG